MTELTPERIEAARVIVEKYADSFHFMMSPAGQHPDHSQREGWQEDRDHE